MAQGIRECFICKKSNAKLRCSVCSSRYYCTKDCQKQDWKRHRKECTALQAENELQKLVASCSIEQANELYHKAIDQVEVLKKYVAKEKDREAKVAKKTPQRQEKPAGTHATSSSSATTSSIVEEQPTTERLETPVPADFALTDLQHLSCYQIFLHEPSCSLEMKYESESTIVAFRADPDNKSAFSLRLPGHILDNRMDTVEEGLLIRLAYQNAPMEETQQQLLSTPDSLRTLACKCCGLALWNPASTSPTRVLPLPSDRWEDMTDYLMCYPGEPVIDVGKSSATCPGDCILEDDASLLLPAEHLLGVCILALTPYGEDPKDDDMDDKNPSAEVRGSRPWRGTGGASLTCSQCASILGFATMEDSVRLLKHRVQYEHSTTIATFVAHEMVRYAENKAIFAFEVYCDDGTDKCLVLRLVRWDGRGATSAYKRNGAWQPKWCRLLQIMFEKIHKQKGPPNDWTKVDWCCVQEEKKIDGGNSPELPASFVRLVLEADEWHELERSLQDGTSFTPRDVRMATILAKTGQQRAELSTLL